MPSGSAFAFGPFHLDATAQRLLRDGAPVPLPARQFQLLHVFVTRPGELLGKDQLIEAAWPDVTVSDNSLAQAVVSLRGILTDSHSACVIETVRGHGYRFTGLVARTDIRQSDAQLDALLAPHRGFTEGRAALETLEREQIAAARATFADLVARRPDDGMVRVGLANACALAFEATRADAAPDLEALRMAVTQAREACRLDPESGEAWATLGFVLERAGDRADAVAALRRGVTLEPNNWRHQLRLSYGSWGEERLRAAPDAGAAPRLSNGAPAGSNRLRGA